MVSGYTLLQEKNLKETEEKLRKITKIDSILNLTGKSLGMSFLEETLSQALIEMFGRKHGSKCSDKNIR